jgi:hypothetical protein
MSIFQPSPTTAHEIQDAAAFRRRLAAAVLVSSLLTSGLAVRADEPEAEAFSPLVGTWIVTIAPPVPAFPPHIGLASFMAGGVMIASPDRFLPPPVATMASSNGVWKWTGVREFASTFVALAYDSSGQAIGHVKINTAYRLTGKDTFEGRSQLLLCDLELKCPAPGPGSALLHGRRLKTQALSNP